MRLVADVYLALGLDVVVAAALGAELGVETEPSGQIERRNDRWCRVGHSHSLMSGRYGQLSESPPRLALNCLSTSRASRSNVETIEGVV